MAERFAKLKEEFFKLLPPTIYFFVTLHIVAIIRVLMVKGTGLPASSTMSIAVASLILGKSVLLADMLPAINLYPEKPLIYNIAWKSTIYLLMSALIHYLERLYDFSKQAGGIVAGNESCSRKCVAAFLGDPDPAFVDRGVFHDPRTRALHRQGPRKADILRPAPARPGGMRAPRPDRCMAALPVVRQQ